MSAPKGKNPHFSYALGIRIKDTAKLLGAENKMQHYYYTLLLNRFPGTNNSKRVLFPRARKTNAEAKSKGTYKL